MGAFCNCRVGLQCPLIGGLQADTPQAMLSDIMSLPHICLPDLTDNNNDDKNKNGNHRNFKAFVLMMGQVHAGQVKSHKAGLGKCMLCSQQAGSSRRPNDKSQINHRASSDHKKCVAGAAAYLLLALLLHLSNAGGVLHIAVLLHSLSCLLQLPAVVLQLLYVVLLLYDGALMLMLLSLQMAHVLLEPLYLREHYASQASQ